MKKTYKSIFSYLAPVLAFVTVLISGAPVRAENVPAAPKNHTPAVNEAEVTAKGFAPVLQKGGLTLYYKTETAEIALYSAENQSFTYSNPQDIDSETRGIPYHRMMSQLYITYYTNNSQIKYYSSYYDALGNNQVSAAVSGDTLRVDYTFGTVKITRDMLPIAIPKEKFEKKVLAGLSADNEKTVKAQYKLISSKDTLSSATRKKYESTYANFNGSDLYILNTYMPDYETEPLYNALYSTDYTQNDCKEDNKAAGHATDAEDTNIIFSLGLLYTLKNDCLYAELDCSKLKALDNADIESVSVLEFFGCGGKRDSGYILVPDGCGGLINFNSAKTGTAPFSGQIYGTDKTVRENNLETEKTHIQIPVFGISRTDGGIFAVAGEGAEYCSINADTSDGSIPYNVGYIRADINPADKMTVANPVYGGGTTKVYVRQKAPYNGRVGISYYVTACGKSTYSDMANLYRGLLVDAGVLKNKLDGEIPFVYGLYGAIDVRKHFLGIPYMGMQALTTFKQAGEITEAFKAAGINQQRIRYYAWCNGGAKQSVLNSIKIVSCLGSGRELEKLSDGKTLVYPDIIFTKVTGRAFDGFSVWRDAAKLTYNEAALIYPVSLSRNWFDYTAGYKYLVSPAKYEKTADKLLKKYKYGNMALADIASDINSDFSKSSYTDRSSSLKITEKLLSRFSENHGIMSSAPNMYAFSVSDILTDMPVCSSGANIIDTEVPFLQLVLSGYKDMASEPINISYGDFSAARLAEYCMLPNYTLSYAESSAVKDTDYSALYSLNWKDYKDAAVKRYLEMNEKIGFLRGQSVISHKILPDGLTVSEYENGARLISNTTASSLDYGGKTVDAGEYIIIKAGER